MARDHLRDVEANLAATAGDPRLALTDADGRPLYRRTSSGNVVRTRKLTRRRKDQALDRDGHRCVWCGSPDDLEIDHIVRYADGGTHDLDNLRTLCKPCHGTRGGR